MRNRKKILSASFVLVAVLAAATAAQPVGPHHGFLGGPWEIVAKMGHEGAAMRLPLSVADENKPQPMDAVLPVMGTPITVRLERYLPDLKWETNAVEDPNGGPVAKLALRGEGLEQDLWLSARDRERQSISAHIGGVAIRELPGGADTAATIRELADPEVVGILLVWLSDTGSPLVYTVKPGKSVTLPDSQGKLSIVRYLPHYSIDRETKKITNVSDQPVNPAVEVHFEGGQGEHGQWLWSNFPMSPHKQQRLPFRAQFVDFHLHGDAGQYILVMAPGAQPHMLYRENDKKRIVPLEIGKVYPFGDKRYSFAVEQVLSGATVETVWKNASEVLLHPAVAATIVQGEQKQPVVLELNKPFHHRTSFGTLVVLYRRVP